MSFLQPWMLLALPAVLIPIIIHLLNRRRHRKLEWGAMMFLLKATRQSRGHAKLRHFLILTARTLVVAGLIFAVSRPLSSGWAGWFGGRSDMVVIVLDRSPSMAQTGTGGADSKRAAALRQVVAAIDTTGAPAHLVLVTNNDAPPREIEDASALFDLPDAQGVDATTDLPGLLATTLEYLIANRVGRTEVWVCSDLQRADWNEQSGQWAAIRSGFSALEQAVRFHLLSYDERPRENLAVRVEGLRREKRDDSAWLSLDIALRREGTTGSRSVPVSIVVDGARSVVDVQLTGDAAALRSQRIPIPADRKRGHGRVEIPDDANRRDNVFYFTWAEPPSRQTLVVSERTAPVRALALAAAPPGGDDRRAARDTAEIIRPEEIGTVEWDEVALLVWQAPLPRGAVSRQIERFVDLGGTVMFLPPESVATSPASIFDVTWGPWDETSADAPFTAESWRDDSGLLCNVQSGASLPVGSLEIRRSRRVDGEGRELARLSNGRPLLLRVPTDRGGVYFCSCLPPQPESNLARQGIVLFAMVQRALAAGTERLEGARFSTIGATHPAQHEATWKLASGGEGGGPSTLSSLRHVTAGVYEVGPTLVARNRPAAEDTVSYVSDEELAGLFGGLDLHIIRGTTGQGDSLVAEIWRLFTIAMVIALIAEACLCLPGRVRAEGAA